MAMGTVVTGVILPVTSGLDTTVAAVVVVAAGPDVITGAVTLGLRPEMGGPLVVTGRAPSSGSELWLSGVNSGSLCVVSGFVLLLASTSGFVVVVVLLLLLVVIVVVVVALLLLLLICC